MLHAKDTLPLTLVLDHTLGPLTIQAILSSSSFHCPRGDSHVDSGWGYGVFLAKLMPAVKENRKQVANISAVCTWVLELA